tara:strand:+ start:222 stop:1175 length:954 start_codon:yes stop_codon:yes gene_type:complete
MNNLQSLNLLIEQTMEEVDVEIIEINTLAQLYELSGASMAGGYGAPMNKDEEQNDMITRENIVTEKLLREYIRNKIKFKLNEEQNKMLREEKALRQVIRKLIAEGDISDVHPHRSTGINTLEDVLKKAIPTLRMDFKRLTTDKKQRDSFRAHIIRAVDDALAPMEVNDKYLQGGADAPSSLLDEPLGNLEENEEEVDFELTALEEQDIEVDITDDELAADEEDRKIPVEDDDEPSPEEEFGTGLEDMDETGRNMAFTSFKKVSQYILDAYDSLANPKDKEVFTEYLITNLKLYFDKFEDELQNTVEEPTSASYQQQA